MARRSRTSGNIALLFGSLLLACGHTNKSDVEPTSAAGSSSQAPACLYGEQGYEEGETFVDSDGCTSCECLDGGVACTRANCPQSPQCDYADQSYPIGSTFLSADGCNTCRCSQGGVVSCTEIDCPPTAASLKADYPAALSEALACDPEGEESCTALVPVGLGCSCEAFGNADSPEAIASLKALQQDYKRVTGFEGECGSCAKPVSGYCGPTGCSTSFNTGGVGCKVEGVVYADGSNFVPDPTSCNDCTCTHGELFCSQQDCEEPCPSGTTLGSDCVQHGDVDNCEVIEHACMPVK